MEHNQVFTFSTCHFDIQCEYTAGGQRENQVDKLGGFCGNQSMMVAWTRV